MKKRYITTTVALMLLTAAVTYGVTLYTSVLKYDEKLDDFNKREQEYARIAEVHGYIDKFYVNDYDEERIIDGALTGMVAFLDDKWSYYLNAEQYASFKSSLDSKMVGIGINAALDYETGGILIFEVVADSPAETAGLQPLDIITAVDDIAVTELGYETAVNKVRGQAGTSVRLRIRKADTGEMRELNIVRRSIELEGIKSQIIANNIGYIKIRSFDTNVDKTFAEALKNLRKAEVSGIIFDVRNNPGGSLVSLVNILDPLLPEGIIISESDKSGEKREFKSDANELMLPMAVLVNEHSISAAEFFAASLQEHNKAVVVGAPTTGKGCAQQQIDLEGGAGLILSTSKYYTSKGLSLAKEGGIVPDVVVELTTDELKNFYKLSANKDRQLQAALQAVTDKINGKTPQ